MIDLLIVNSDTQRLCCFDRSRLVASYCISTAAKGMGELENSFKTPRGWHQISAKIGDYAPKNAIFTARAWQGSVYSSKLAKQYPSHDWILTRILRLGGLTSGVNRGVNDAGLCVDSWHRYIYIHGTADEKSLGTPASHGCIRMGNDDIVDLYAKTPLMTKVLIL